MTTPVSSPTVSIVQMFKNAELAAPDLGAWQLESVLNEDNLAYLLSNRSTREAIWIDPVREDLETMVAMTRKLEGYRVIAVIDTHTHADHISGATELARHFKAPLIMHALSAPSTVDLRVARDTELSTAAGPLGFILTPGHTRDSLCVTWGPFFFAGDTILFGDTGRDDLPTGSAPDHFESLVKLKKLLKPETVFLTNHDSRARACDWAYQLKNNASLKQEREDFVRESEAFRGPSPKKLKESLFENFK